MIPLRDAPAGYSSPIHQGLIHQPTLWKAPHRLAIYNILVCMIICLYVSWRWALSAAGIHGVAALCWLYDPHLIEIFWRALRLPSSWGV